MKKRERTEKFPPLLTLKEMVTSPHTLKTAPTANAVSTADESFLKLSSLTKSVSITCL